MSRPATMIVAILGLTVAGCDSRPGTPPPPGKAGVVAQAPVRTTTIAAVAERDGATLVELPLGADDHVTAGQFFRIRAGDRIKGLVQIVEGAGPHRSMARVVAVTDRQDPLAPGDAAIEVRDLGELTDPGRVTAGIARETAADQATANRDEAAFTNLRRQYDQELAALRTEHQRSLDALRTATADERAEAARVQAATIDRLVLEHQAAVVAAREDQRRTTEAGWAEERTRLLAESAERRSEAERLRAQVDGLARQSQEFAIRLAEAQRAGESVKAVAAAQVRAETETRQVLAARLQVLQAQLAGRSATIAPVLVTDPRRSEPVLVQLERSERERLAMVAEAAALRSAAEESHAARLRIARELAERETAIAALRSELGRTAGDVPVGDRLAAQVAEIAGLREALAAAELARLESERAYLDLATRVLRSAPDGLPILQGQVRERMAAPEAGK